MADKSAAVTIRLGTAGAEAVKATLRGLGREGQQALAQLEAASKRPSVGLLALNDTMRAARGELAGYASQLGPLGAGLQAFGTRGLLIAGGITAASAAIVGLGRASIDAAGKVADLQDRAEEFGVGPKMLQGLYGLGAEVGRSVEDINSALGKFTAESAQAADGQGPLIEALKQYAPWAAEYVRLAKTQEDRIRGVARAVSEASSAEAKAAISRAAFGRSGLAFTNALAGAGGDLEAALSKYLTYTDEQLTQAREVDAIYDQIANTVETRWNGALLNIVGTTRTWLGELTDWLNNVGNSSIWDRIRNAFPVDPTNKLLGVETPTPTSPDGDHPAVTINKPALPAPGPWRPLPPSKGDAGKAARDAAREEAAAEREHQAALQGSASILLALGDANRTYGLEVARVSAFVKEGALTQQQAEQHLASYRKELQETIDREKDRNALLPETARLAKEAGDLTGQLDSALAGGLRSTAGTLADITMQTTTLAQGFQNVGNSIMRATLEAIYMKNVVSPIASGISGFASNLFGGASATSITGTAASLQAAKSITSFAGGGRIVGPGTPTSDSVLIRGSVDEHIVNARAANRYRPLLDAMNAGLNVDIPGFASGGRIGVGTAEIGEEAFFGAVRA